MYSNMFNQAAHVSLVFLLVVSSPISQSALPIISIGLEPHSYDIIFRGQLRDLYLPKPNCRLIPAHVREWNLFIDSDREELAIAAIDFRADSDFVSFESTRKCSQSHCQVTIKNECMKSGEMRVQIVLGIGQGEGRVDIGFFVRKRCGGAMAEGMKIELRSEPAEAPIAVVVDGVPNPGLRPWLGVAEEQQSSWLTLSSPYPYSISSLSLTVKSSEVLTLSVSGDLQEIYPSFLELLTTSQLIDNLSDDYVTAVSTNVGVSLQQLEYILSGNPPMRKPTVSHIRIDPNTDSIVDFPPLVHESEGPIGASPKEMRVEYECLQPGVTEIVCEIRLKNTFNPYEPIVFSWDKTCGGFVNPYLRIGLEEGKGDVLRQGVVQDQFASGTAAVPVHTRESTFHFSLLQGSQAVSPPSIHTSGVCSAHITRMTALTLLSTRSDNCTVTYECTGKGACLVSLRMDMVPAMAPYGGVSLRWTKMCGGPATGLNVYSKAAKRGRSIPDILRNGTFVAQSPLTVPSSDEELTLGLSFSLPEQLKVSLRVVCETDVCEPFFIDESDSRMTLTETSQPSDLYEPVTLQFSVECELWSNSFIGITVLSLVVMGLCGCGMWGIIAVMEGLGIEITSSQPKDHQPLAEPSSALFNLYPEDGFYGEYESESDVA